MAGDTQNTKTDTAAPTRFARLRAWFVGIGGVAVLGVIALGFSKYGTDLVYEFLAALFPPRQIVEKIVKPTPAPEAKKPRTPLTTGSIRPAKPAVSERAKCLEDQNTALIQNMRKIENARAELEKCKIDFKTARVIFWTDVEVAAHCDTYSRIVMAHTAVGRSIESWCSPSKP